MQEVIHFLRELNCVRVAIVVQCWGLLLLHVVLHFSKSQVQKHTVKEFDLRSCEMCPLDNLENNFLLRFLLDAESHSQLILAKQWQYHSPWYWVRIHHNSWKVKHHLIRKAFNIHLKHHVFESLLNTLNVLSDVKPKVLFEWQQSLSSSNWDIYLRALTADFFFFVLIKVYRQRLSHSSSYRNIDDRTLLADPVLVLIKDW